MHGTKHSLPTNLFREPHIIAADLMKVSNVLEELGYDIRHTVGQGVSVEIFLLTDRLRRMSREVSEEPVKLREFETDRTARHWA